MFFTACALGTGGVRLLARGVRSASGAPEAVGPLRVSASSLHRVTTPADQAARPAGAPATSAGANAPAPRRPMIPMPNAAHLARLADEVRTRFTPVTIDSVRSAGPAEAHGDERSGRGERVQLAVDPASA